MRSHDSANSLRPAPGVRLERNRSLSVFRAEVAASYRAAEERLHARRLRPGEQVGVFQREAAGFFPEVRVPSRRAVEVALSEREAATKPPRSSSLGVEEVATQRAAAVAASRSPSMKGEAALWRCWTLLRQGRQARPPRQVRPRLRPHRSLHHQHPPSRPNLSFQSRHQVGLAHLRSRGWSRRETLHRFDFRSLRPDHPQLFRPPPQQYYHERPTLQLLIRRSPNP